MKSLTLFLILFIIKSSVSQSKLKNYSVNTFISNLKSQGTFNIIKSVKFQCGDDVAIITCETINKNYSGNCKRLVIEYMDNSGIVGGKPSHGSKNQNKPRLSSRPKSSSSKPKPTPR